MSAWYLMTRGGVLHSLIDAEQARRLYEQAEGDEHANLQGDLAQGFHYWAGYHESAGPLVRVRVQPVAPEHPPPERSAGARDHPSS